MKTFAYGILAGFALVLGGLASAYAALALFWPTSLPGPALSTMVQLDEKLRHIRNRQELDPTILAIGSSIAWRQTAGEAFQSLGENPQSFFNGGSANLQLHQSRELLSFYLDHFRRVHTVLLMTSIPDFNDCTDSSAELIDREDTAAYVFDRWPAAHFYLRYFSPQRYARTALTLAKRRTPFIGDLFIDQYGTGPLQVPTSWQRGLRYGEIELDAACIQSLVQLSRELSERGLRFVVVFAPVHPEYRTRYPDAMRWLRDTALHVRKTTEVHNTHVVSLYDDPSYVENDFFDAFHLQWPGVQRLSEQIVQSIEESFEGGESAGSTVDQSFWSSGGIGGSDQ